MVQKTPYNQNFVPQLYTVMLWQSLFPIPTVQCNTTNTVTIMWSPVAWQGLNSGPPRYKLFLIMYVFMTEKNHWLKIGFVLQVHLHNLLHRSFYTVSRTITMAALNRSNTKPFKPGFKTHRYEKATTRTRADEKSKQKTEESCKSLQ